MNDLHLLEVYDAKGKTRCGALCDGGYVFVELTGGYDCYISAGVSDEESFSRDFILKYDMHKDQCYAFDGTIHDFPYHYTDRITFVRKNIGDANTNEVTNLSFLTEKFNNIFLKMDIEGGEFPWLLNIPENDLSKFKQIVIEVHCINDDRLNITYNDKMKCLEKLKKTHFLVHAHANNCCSLTHNFPDLLELTYVNKRDLACTDLNTTPLPIPNLDYPNNGVPNSDWGLAFYPFISKDVLLSPTK